MRILLLALLSMAQLSCKKVDPKPNGPLESQPVKFSQLLETFRYAPTAKPIISVHRGGKGIAHYPENCLETLKYINDSITAIFEIDIAKTKDNVLVLLHDNTLERTTTGQGKLTDYTFAQLQELYLVDDYGNTTDFKIPLFKTVLEWARDNNVVLTLDIKKSVAVEDVVQLVEDTKAENVSVIITYDLQQAEHANAIAPGLLLSVSARNDQELEWLLRSGIPTENMVAFTGTRVSPDRLYQKIHSHGIKTMLGTLGNLDNSAAARGDSLYNVWIAKGIDIIATDRPFAVAKRILH